MSDQHDRDDLGPTPTDPEPRKLLLGKKVVRHFAVKTNIQTGNASTNTNCINPPLYTVVKVTSTRC